ncbi:MAG: hypothetical protein KatS3mg111_2081 [Pirellulaceae bacterium]|nr:MAG: hypothetical protein KatS3mg111_2081 [Pirellulaceae bacterium]
MCSSPQPRVKVHLACSASLPTPTVRSRPRLGARWRYVPVLIFLVIATGCTRRSPPAELPQTQLIRGLTMGTSYAVKIPSFPEMPGLPTLAKAIDGELDRINRQMSTYLSDSDISRFNQSRSTDWIELPAELVALVALSEEISRQTDGRFDITVKPLVDLWGFGASGPVDSPPTKDEIAETLHRVGWELIQFRHEPPALRKRHPEVEIDLSGIAKGYAVDRVAEILDGYRVPAYFVEIGGEVRCKGQRTDGGPWRIGIERPDEDQRSVLEVLELNEGAVATSGDYRNFFEHEGKRFQHTIDPTTGYPVRDPVASASVVADQCAWADAVATAMMALGAERAQQLAQAKGWAVLLVLRNDNKLKTVRSGAFARRFSDRVDAADVERERGVESER